MYVLLHCKAWKTWTVVPFVDKAASCFVHCARIVDIVTSLKCLYYSTNLLLCSDWCATLVVTSTFYPSLPLWFSPLLSGVVFLTLHCDPDPWWKVFGIWFRFCFRFIISGYWTSVTRVLAWCCGAYWPRHRKEGKQDEDVKWIWKGKWKEEYKT
jgi:hypothetical protein